MCPMKARRAKWFASTFAVIACANPDMVNTKTQENCNRLQKYWDEYKGKIFRVSAYLDQVVIIFLFSHVDLDSEIFNIFYKSSRNR